MNITQFKAAALTLALPGLLASAAPAAGFSGQVAPQVMHSAGADISSHSNRGRHDGWERGRGNRYESRDRRGRYQGEPIYANTRIWRGRDGRYYCRKNNGTTGLLIGAAVGGVVGHEVAGSGDRTLGAILGAAGGAILGRAIDRSNTRCR